MPNRIIKDSIRTSKTVNAMTDFQFRLWVYLITYVDDFGRGSADPELLKSLVFPRRKGITESQIQKALAEMANTGIVHLYNDSDGEPFLCFPNWAEHQRIQNKKSKFPAPPESLSPSSTVTHGELPPESNTIQSNIYVGQPEAGDTKPRFVKPSLEEVAAYCKQRRNTIDPQRFMDYYDSNGWIVGKTHMKDWKAAVRTWERNKKQSASSPAYQDPDARIKRI